MTSRNLIVAGIIVAAVALALGYGVAGIWWGIPTGPIIGIVWFWAWRRNRRWAAGLGLTLTVMVAVNLVFRGVIPVLESGDSVWSLAATAAALVAWNATLFNEQLTSIGNVNDRAELESGYLRRLMAVTVGGVLLALIAIFVQISFDFGVAIALGLVSVIGLSQALRFLGREST